MGSTSPYSPSPCLPGTATSPCSWSSCPPANYSHHKIRYYQTPSSQSSCSYLGTVLSDVVNEQDHIGRTQGRAAIPKRMNFWKSSKRPLTPPLIFGKSYCAFFIMATEPSKVAGTIMQVGMRARQYAIHAHDTYIGLGLAPLSGDRHGNRQMANFQILHQASN